MSSLLAVDLGMTTGLALYGRDGKLRWYRSHHYGNRDRLKRAAFGLIGALPDLALIVLEGGGSIAEIWEHEAARRGIPVRRIGAETWRRAILYPREHRSGAEAKRRCRRLAGRAIDWSGARRLKALRHDTAEAILIGLWGVVELGWLDRVPDELRH